ncbi:putative transient receptor potential channel Flc/Pkd2 [Plasmopara halstedii]
MGLLCCAAKCCGCIALSQLCALLLPLAILVLLGFFFYTYAIPWGEDQIRQALNLTSDVDIGNLNASYIAANNCTGCVLGSNTQWPTNTTGPRHFLDSKAGSTASGVIATSLAGAAVIGTSSMLWASTVPTAAAALSFSSGFYEMTHIVEQAQFAGMISQLRIEGAPTFLIQFSKELSWTNFNFIRGGSSDSNSTGRRSQLRRLSDSISHAADAVSMAGETGPARYAALIGVDANNLFFYTLLTFVAVIAALHVLYVLFILIAGSILKSNTISDMARKWYRKVIWAVVLALLLAQYSFAMAGCYLISNDASGDSAKGVTSRFTLGIVALVVIVLLTLGLGVTVIGKNPDELKDVGTYEHNQRPFSSKYSAYYDQYNFDNRFFFVPRILLAVGTGAIVGIVRDATSQLLCILAVMMLYLILLLLRQPNLLPFLYYVGITSVFLKVVLIGLMLLIARDDYFPQNLRDNMAYGIIGINIFIFALLFIRQAYMIVHATIIACRHKKYGKRDSNLDATGTNTDFGNSSSPVPSFELVESTPLRRGGDWYGNKQFDQNQQSQSHQHQYGAHSSTMSGYSTQSSNNGQLENVPMLEPASEPVPIFSRSRGKNCPPLSHNTTPAPAAPAPEVPTYDVLAAYLGTSSMQDEAAFSATSLSAANGHTFRNNHIITKELTSPGGLNLSRTSATSRGLSLSRGLASSQNLTSSRRDLSSSRGLKSSRGTATMSGSGFGSRSSSAALDAYVENFSNSGAKSSSSRRQHIVNLYQDVSIDDVDIDDDTAETFELSSSSQSFDPSASGASTSSSFAMMQSYVNFSDSTVSVSRQSTIKQPDNTFSTVIDAAHLAKSGGFGSSPQAKMSIFSNDSEGSFDGDHNSWIKHHSGAATSTDDRESEALEGQSYELGPFGVTKSAFSRDSVDSYCYQSKSNFTTSRLNFNAKGQHNEGGSDDGSSKRRSSNQSSNLSSNQSFLSAHSDDSFSYFDVDRDRSVNDHSNTLTL